MLYEGQRTYLKNEILFSRVQYQGDEFDDRNRVYEIKGESGVEGQD